MERISVGEWMQRYGRPAERPMPQNIVGLPPVDAVIPHDDSRGSFYELVTRPGYVALPSGTRSSNPENRRNTPLLTRKAQQASGNRGLADPPGVLAATSEGVWVPDETREALKEMPIAQRESVIRELIASNENASPYSPSVGNDRYVQGKTRVPGRPEKGIEPLLSGSQSSVVLTDPAMRSGRLRPAEELQPSYSPLPGGELAGTTQKGVVTADEVVFWPRAGSLPVDIGPILADYGYKSNIRTGMPFPERSIDPNQADETGFSSLDPTQIGGSKGQSNINPYGVVEMPAIDARGRWFDQKGRPLITRVDPTQVVEVRTANPDATFTADQTDEITLGRRVNELQDEYRTPVMSASRLNELRQQGRAVVSPGEGSLKGYVARYDLEDRPIIRSGDRSFIAPAADYQLQEGERVVGVKKGVPVYRTEPVYSATTEEGVPLQGKRTVPAGRSSAQEMSEPIYRIGSPMSNDMDAIRAELQPLISGSGTKGAAVRVGLGDLALALQRGTASFADQPGMSPQLGLPIPGIGGQTYVQRGNMAPALIAPRLRPDGTPIPGAFLVENQNLGRRPVGPAPFLVAPEGSTQDQINTVGGIRRKGESIGPGKPFKFLLSDLGKGAFMANPDIASGYAKIAEMLENGQLSLQQLKEEGAIRPGTREEVLLAQAVRERRPGTRVDLFAEEPIAPEDLEMARAMGAKPGLDREDIGGVMDQSAGSIAGDERVGAWGDFGDGSGGERRGFSVQSMPIEGQSQIEPFVQYAQALTKDRKQAEYLAEVAIKGTKPRAQGAALDPSDVLANIQFMAGQPVYSGRSVEGRAPARMIASMPAGATPSEAPAAFPANPSMRSAEMEATMEQPVIPGVPTDPADLSRGYTPDPIDEVEAYMKKQAGKPSYRYIEPNAWRTARQLSLLRGR